MIKPRDQWDREDSQPTIALDFDATMDEVDAAKVIRALGEFFGEQLEVVSVEALP